MRAYLVTGNPGSGKSAIRAELSRRGLIAIGTDGLAQRQAARRHRDPLEHLPPAAERARRLAAIVDGYGLTTAQRHGFVELMIELAICDTAASSKPASRGRRSGGCHDRVREPRSLPIRGAG